MKAESGDEERQELDDHHLSVFVRHVGVKPGVLMRIKYLTVTSRL